MPANTSSVNDLENRLGRQWNNIRQAQQTTTERRQQLQRLFEDRVAPDTSVVLFGSIARAEMTSGSDADWILLVDGQSFPEHQKQTTDAGQLLHENHFGEPGRSGVFGCMVSSHGLVHQIGGEDDKNSNTTRRVLLLLESVAVGDTEAYNRVRRQILNRYIRDDRGLLYGTGEVKVPRFLLNDLTRYWRTITVDFVYKQRADAGKKWALRNAKLRMSRKLVFTSGLLRCFFCQIDPAAAQARELLIRTNDPTDLLSYLEGELIKTPLELLAQAASRDAITKSTAQKLFDSYDGFLGVLDDGQRREDLAHLSQDEMANSVVWQEIREMSRQFQSGLNELFYGQDESLKNLMISYGVF
jgi:predicted nucleotidyltransferase